MASGLACILSSTSLHLHLPTTSLSSCGPTGFAAATAAGSAPAIKPSLQLNGSSCISGSQSWSPSLTHNATSRIKGSKRRGKVIMATGETESSNSFSSVFEGLQEAWEKTDDKLAIGALGFAALIVLWSSTGLISAIDKLPLLPAIFEIVGLLFTGWFVYKNLIFKPDREELVKKIESAKEKITGQ